MFEVTVMYFGDHEVIGIDIEVEAQSKDEALKSTMERYKNKKTPAGLRRFAGVVVW